MRLGDSYLIPTSSDPIVSSAWRTIESSAASPPLGDVPNYLIVFWWRVSFEDDSHGGNLVVFDKHDGCEVPVVKRFRRKLYHDLARDEDGGVAVWELHLFPGRVIHLDHAALDVFAAVVRISIESEYPCQANGPIFLFLTLVAL